MGAHIFGRKAPRREMGGGGGAPIPWPILVSLLTISGLFSDVSLFYNRCLKITLYISRPGCKINGATSHRANEIRCYIKKRGIFHPATVLHGITLVSFYDDLKASLSIVGQSVDKWFGVGPLLIMALPPF